MIAVLKNGVIVEKGKHEALMEMVCSLYILIYHQAFVCMMHACT